MGRFFLIFLNRAWIYKSKFLQSLKDNIKSNSNQNNDYYSYVKCPAHKNNKSKQAILKYGAVKHEMAVFCSCRTMSFFTFSMNSNPLGMAIQYLLRSDISLLIRGLLHIFPKFFTLDWSPGSRFSDVLSPKENVENKRRIIR